MAKLTAKERREIPSNEFAGPDRSYPIEDASHARNALARASEMHKKGKLSTSQYERIREKAHRKLKNSGHML